MRPLITREALLALFEVEVGAGVEAADVAAIDVEQAAHAARPDRRGPAERAGDRPVRSALEGCGPGSWNKAG